MVQKSHFPPPVGREVRGKLVRLGDVVMEFAGVGVQLGSMYGWGEIVGGGGRLRKYGGAWLSVEAEAKGNLNPRFESDMEEGRGGGGGVSRRT